MLNLGRWETLAASVLCLALAHPVLADCTVPGSWFSGGSIPKPKPEEFDSKSNCDFHQISWQYFLWLTEVEGGKLRFEALYSEEAIHPKTQDARNENLHLVLQAGSLGILVDQKGRATYTSIMMNKTYRDFVLSNKLYDPTKLQKFPPTTDFPVGSLSLKASWKIVQEGEDVSRFYATQANIHLLAEVNGSVGFPEEPVVAKNVTVALVGLHIAVVVKGHPEAIWATFEHVDNAPNMYTPLKPSDPVAETNYTFYKAGTTASESNQNNAKINPPLTLVDGTQKLTPITQVFRQYPYGGGDSVNQNNIASINRGVASQLASSSVWRNYMEVGAIWFAANDGLVPDWNPTNPKPPLTGSITLSSAVIETFTQQDVKQNNCFGCHNTMALINTPRGVDILPGKNVNTSHILLQNYVGGNPVDR